MRPDLQKVLEDSLVILVPIFATWAAARLRKAQRDINAAFGKIRAHERHLGIETQASTITRGADVTSHSKAPTRIGTDDPGEANREGG
jgi:hypothetical protein